ncbi:hypothetical protein OK016_17125 [Vibrio chagasii]|nr:hypothetical protein [Vibrio chagasii]
MNDLAIEYFNSTAHCVKPQTTNKQKPLAIEQAKHFGIDPGKLRHPRWCVSDDTVPANTDAHDLWAT